MGVRGRSLRKIFGKRINPPPILRRNFQKKRGVFINASLDFWGPPPSPWEKVTTPPRLGESATSPTGESCTFSQKNLWGSCHFLPNVGESDNFPKDFSGRKCNFPQWAKLHFLPRSPKRGRKGNFSHDL